MNKLLLGINLIRNIGIKPIAYRAWHVFKIKSGLIKKYFPEEYKIPFSISLNEWREKASPFFFHSKESLSGFELSEKEKDDLKKQASQIKEGNLNFFSGKEFFLGKDYDWVTHPESKFRFDNQKHWSAIETLDPAVGDIKYIWEKSRFSYLYSIIRYDHYFQDDQSEFVFSEILSWIKHNPVNRGPNFSCSQELSIRMLNWTFALYYYRNSPNLTEERFQTIIRSIYEQSQHVSAHLPFSLISVRNNHAITEALLLYSVGILFPFFPESRKWQQRGKYHLEEEGLYQIYNDGSYLQFSMNYERVVIQLYTWAFFLAKANDQKFSDKLYKRVDKALNFLYQLQDKTTGMLPNYGANDGALFFPLNATAFRDYRGQLNALYYFYNEKHLYENGPWLEDVFWFNRNMTSGTEVQSRTSQAFSEGGFYTLRDSDKFCFIRCGNHKDRPSQADNLHLDIWVNGKNILRDAGSYKYNATPEETRFFMGTASHNTVMIGDLDQMLKGGRFLWYYWTQAVYASIEENEDYQLFKGRIKAFHHSGNTVFHERIVKQFRKELKWEVEDRIEGSQLPMKQIWNLNSEYSKQIEFLSTDSDGKELQTESKSGWYSPTYGVKESSPQHIIHSNSGYIRTTISFKG